MTNDMRVAVRHGTVIFERVEKRGPGWYTERFCVDLMREQAGELVMQLDGHFDLIGYPPMLPLDVFDALPLEKRREVMERGFRLYDKPEDLKSGALVYDISLKRA